MTWRVRFAGLRSLLLGSDGQDTAASCHPTNSHASGPASNVCPWLRPDGSLQLPARRMALLLETRRARDLRQSKMAAALESDLRAVTHQMMAIYLGRAK